jgi:hypothetical protein
MVEIPEEVYGIVAAIITFITGGGALKAYQEIMKIRKENQKNRIPGVVDNVMDIYGVLHAIQRETGAGRVLILRASNGGSKPHPGKPLYVSVLYEVGVMGLVQQEWEKRQVDENYIEILSQMTKKEILEIRTAEMLPGMLKDIYVKDAVIYSKISVIDTSETDMLYISVVHQTERPSDPRSKAKRRAAIRAGIARIRKLMEEIPR